MIHLKPREHYEDIYDEGTVEQCRSMRDAHLPMTDENIEEPGLTTEQASVLKEVRNSWVGLVQEMSTFFAAAERFNNKEAVIEKWMQEDKAKDDLMARSNPPAAAKCRKCSSRDLKVIDKDLYGGLIESENGSERVLFMFKCNKCDTNSAFFENGEEWIVEPTRCPECRSEKVTFTKDLTNDVLTITYTCGLCDHVWDEIHDYGSPPTEPEKPDPNYHEDRKLFCYSKKVRRWAEDMKNSPMTYSRPSWEENEAEKLYRAELEKIEMLTIAQVDKRLNKILTEHGYKDFQLGKPDLDKEITVMFTAVDNQEDRNGDDSRRMVWKLISNELEPTNWRLVRSSLEYRVGYIKGKLKAYEHKFEFKKLVDRKLKSREIKG